MRCSARGGNSQRPIFVSRMDSLTSYKSSPIDATLERVIRFHSFVRYTAIAVALISGSVLLGWAIGNKTLQRILPGMTTMKVNTALELLLLAMTLYSAYRRTRFWEWIAFACVVLVFALGAMTLAEYAFDVDLRIDNFLFVDRDPIRFPGRNAPATLFCFFAIGISLLLLMKRRWIVWAQIALILTSLAPLAMLGGYLYGTPSMYATMQYPVVPLNTAICMMLLCLGGLLLRGGDGLMRIASSESAAGMVARRLLPLSFALPATAGLLTLAGEQTGLYSRAWEAAILVSYCALFFSASVWWTASLLRRTEQLAHDYAERFREFADAMPLIVWMSRPDGSPEFYNQRWYEFTGMARGRIENVSWEKVLHLDDLQNCLTSWESAVRSQQPFQGEYHFFNARTNRYRWLLARARPMRGADGKIVRWYGTCTDIDDQKNAEETAKITLREAETA